MTGIEDLAAHVRQLAAAAAELDADMAGAAARIDDLAVQVHQLARQAEDPGPLIRAAESLAAAARKVGAACQYARRTHDRGTAYADGLAHGAAGSPRAGASVPVSDSDIAARTTANRIDLADNVPGTGLLREYGGYLDVVMHGDPSGVAARIGQDDVEFSIDQVEQMVRSSPAWRERPIRLMSCSTGQADYAQQLADRLGVAVYAPSDILQVGGGEKVVLNDGAWRRFEPGR